ncbi:response regulator [Galbitalea soli]|uniref:Response regulator n=1 Tax=Galbitalea soli TaxID=1268042 RepID=A0A7C9PLM4_9MICO|nr:response regulator [Galbitalea soli]NYJ30856.1 DNA-binding response OmpR family regulator [Galbitalea soli]
MPSDPESRVAVVVEDDADIRNLLQTVLTQGGFEVYTASNGLDGLEAVRRHSPLVTTLDVNMPGMNGFEAARQIRAISTTYIVMLTALSEEVDTIQGLEAGADDFVTKPFRPRELRARIEAILRRPRHVLGTEAVPGGGVPHATPVYPSGVRAPELPWSHLPPPRLPEHWVAPGSEAETHQEASAPTEPAEDVVEPAAITESPATVYPLVAPPPSGQRHDGPPPVLPD